MGLIVDIVGRLLWNSTDFTFLAEHYGSSGGMCTFERREKGKVVH